MSPDMQRAWRAARDAIRCPVVRAFFLRLPVDAMSIAEAGKMRAALDELAARGVPRGSDDLQWRRAALLVSCAVHDFAAASLDAQGRIADAAEVRAMPRVDTVGRGAELDRALARYERENIAVRHAAYAAGWLGDIQRPSLLYKRVGAAEMAGDAMQEARTWDAGVKALLAAAKLREGAK